MLAGDLGDDWSLVASFVSAVDTSLGQWLHDNHHVGLTEYRSLTLIAAVPERELRVNALADQVGLSQSSATRLIGRLETKELARRDVCTADGRGVYAVITEKGEALVVNARKAYAGRIAELLGGPPPLGSQPAAGLDQALRRVAVLIHE